MMIMTKTQTYMVNAETIEKVHDLYQQKVDQILNIEENWGNALDEVDKEMSNGEQ